MMRRRVWHALFGVVAAGCAAFVAVQGVRLQRIGALNDAIAAAAKSPAATADRSAARELRLARAVALAAGGDHDAAFKAYSELIERGPLDAIGRQALFNLGNLHLRQGIAQTAEATPMIELAKQRYRDLLRVAPDEWDARYNLERALRLAPEEQPALVEADNVPVERRRIMLRGMDAGELP